jgi:hypothetical protein
MEGKREERNGRERRREGESQLELQNPTSFAHFFGHVHTHTQTQTQTHRRWAKSFKEVQGCPATTSPLKTASTDPPSLAPPARMLVAWLRPSEEIGNQMKESNSPPPPHPSPPSSPVTVGIELIGPPSSLVPATPHASRCCPPPSSGSTSAASSWPVSPDVSDVRKQSSPAPGCTVCPPPMLPSPPRHSPEVPILPPPPPKWPSLPPGQDSCTLLNDMGEREMC